MALPCPECGRPNADRALKCLYCSILLPSVDESDVTEASPTSGSADGTSRHLIILAPVEGPLDGPVAALSGAASVSLYDARLMLAARRHRLLRNVETASEAELLSRRLAESGIRNVTIPESDLNAIVLRQVTAATFGATALQLRLTAAQTAAVPYDDLLLLVKGELARERFEEKRVATTRRPSQRLTPTYRLHLYSFRSGAFDVDPEAFDWTVLGDEETCSLFLNMEKFVAGIVKRAPAVEIEDRFGREAVVLTRKEAGHDPAVMLARETRASEGVLYDNEPQFRYYARWRYLVAQSYPSNVYTAG